MRTCGPQLVGSSPSSLDVLGLRATPAPELRSISSVRLQADANFHLQSWCRLSGLPIRP